MKILQTLILVPWLIPATAHAHVKWFAPYNVAEQPRVLVRVVDADFIGLVLLGLSIVLLGCLVDRTPIGVAVARALDRVTAPIAAQSETLIRATCAFFLISIWALGGVLLTPELKTDSPTVALIQLGSAGALLLRRTTFLAGCGIVALYLTGVHEYGLFHLLDYPIFLGVAIYLANVSFGFCERLRVSSLDIVRCLAAITLMWASVEKWAYPQWTFPLFVAHPQMSLGYDFHLFMCAAGVIEFTLAFGLLLSPLVRRACAFILFGMFVAATFEFGKIDVIGHSAIVAALLAIASEPVRLPAPRRAWRLVLEPTAAYAAALATFVALYYGLHTILFGAGSSA